LRLAGRFRSSQRMGPSCSTINAGVVVLPITRSFRPCAEVSHGVAPEARSASLCRSVSWAADRRSG
jgi:hypothetical protein